MSQPVNTHLLGEIIEQPQVLQRLIEVEYPAIQTIARDIRQMEPDSILIAARGTSDNAAIYAKYLFGTLNRLPVMLAAPSLYTLYQTPPRLHHTLVLGISQSGASPDIVAVLEDGRRQGMPTLAITNIPESPLGEAADYIIPCHAGEERSVAATKSYTAELLALALLAVALAEDEARLAELRAVPAAVDATLTLRDTLARRAERYRYMNTCAVIGRGYNYATAFEIALKLKELTYVVASPYSSADFRHGPIAMAGAGFPVLVIAPGGAMFPDLLALIRELEARHTELIVISDQPEALRDAELPLRLPAPLPEWLSPLTAVLPGQLLGYYLALAKGFDPEKPRGLRKVTETL